MKRFTALIMAVILAVMVMACTSGKQSTNESKTPDKESTAVFKPSQNFNIRVPFAAGGAADTIARIFAQGLQKTFEKSAVVNNLTGANGAIAATDLLNAKTDATELMVGGIGMFTLAPLFNKEVQLKIEDFQFIASLVSEDIMLFVNPQKTGIKDWEELKKYAEKERIVFGSNAPGGTTHLLGTMLFGEAGIQAEAVTSDGSAKDLLALAGGNVVCALATSSLGAQYIGEGGLVPIVVFSEEPYTGYDGITVPTAKSLGYDIVFKTCNFIMTKADVNTTDAQAIYQAILDYSSTEEFKELAKNANYVPVIDNGEKVKKLIQGAADMCKQAYEKYYAK